MPTPPAVANTRDRSRAWPWPAPIVVFGLALAVYLRTAPAGLTWAHDSADGGDLITAALVGGVPHPTGYPTFTLLARLLTHLPWGAPAWRVMLLSALGGALAAALITATLQTLLADRSGQSVLPVVLSALAAGLMLAFAPLLWGQATVAEVYALQACLAAGLLWSLAQWRRTGHRSWPLVAGLLVGLALGNHLTTLWLLPLALTWLADGAADRPRLRQALGRFTLALVAGLLVYSYPPLAAAGDPPVNWGNPRTLAGFWWLASGRLYHPFAFAVEWQDVLARLRAWAGLLWRDFLPWGLALALGGLALAWRRSAWVTGGALASLFLGLAWAVGYNTSDSLLTLLPGWVLIALWAGLGLAALLRQLDAARAGAQPAAALLCLALALFPLARHWSAQDIHADRQAETFVAAVLAAAEPQALVVTAGDRATFSLWYARYGLKQRPDLALIGRDLWGLASYRATVGQAHPQLATPLPAELPALLSQEARRRPVYLTQVEPSASDAAALGLAAGYRLEPILLVAGDAASHWTLWRLRPLPRSD